VVISDGLNADAIHENLRLILPSLKRQILSFGHHVGDTDVTVENGRVRAGYHIGELLDVDVVVHFIGERPGTGLNTLSAYITYGRNPEGLSRWSPDLDHSNTTAVCGINRLGKHPGDAAEKIARVVHRMLEQRQSGVALSRQPASS
jgi:ethanolamine ammonia-lyase large subunit